MKPIRQTTTTTFQFLEARAHLLALKKSCCWELFWEFLGWRVTEKMHHLSSVGMYMLWHGCCWKSTRPKWPDFNQCLLSHDVHCTVSNMETGIVHDFSAFLMAAGICMEPGGGKKLTQTSLFIDIFYDLMIESGGGFVTSGFLLKVLRCRSGICVLARFFLSSSSSSNAVSKR